jgi:hypothetical protein
MLVFMVHFLLLFKSPEFDIGCQAPCLMRGQNAATYASRQSPGQDYIFAGLSLSRALVGAGVHGALRGVPLGVESSTVLQSSSKVTT